MAASPKPAHPRATALLDVSDTRPVLAERAHTHPFYTRREKSLPATPTVSSIATAWARHREKINDDELPVLLAIDDVTRVREYAWTRESARNSPEEWDALTESMRTHGWDPKRPAHLMVGKDGRAKLGEGNHRLAIARRLGIREVPVWVHFYTSVDGGHRVVGPEEVESATVERLYTSRADLPPQLKSLTLPQANYWSKVFDAVKGREVDAGASDRLASGKAAGIAWHQTRKQLERHGRVPHVERLPAPTPRIGGFEREVLRDLGFESPPEEIDLNHAWRHVTDEPRDYAAHIIAKRILTGQWDCHGREVDALLQSGVHPWHTVVGLLREVDPDRRIEDPPKPEGMIEAAAPPRHEDAEAEARLEQLARALAPLRLDLARLRLEPEALLTGEHAEEFDSLQYAFDTLDVAGALAERIRQLLHEEFVSWAKEIGARCAPR